MKTLKWLLRRELWEHKGMLVWAPTVVAALIAALASLALLLGRNITLNSATGATDIGSVSIEGHMRQQIVDAMAQTYMAAAAPLYLMLAFLVFFYCLGALHDERRDRSLLFWKSLPVSDQMTVLSKAVLALVVAPLITIAIALALALFVLLCASGALLAHGTNLFGSLLLAPELYLAPLRVLGMLPVYLLWALPTVGWLLLVSSMARSKVFLWAVGTPIAAGLLLLWAERALKLAVDAHWFIENIVDRILLGVVPGCWFLFEMDRTAMTALMERQTVLQPHTLLAASWATLGNASVWLGAAAGIAMLAAACWMRRRREEA
ncbi:MAG: hypothetical protein ACEQSK_20285 [Sphingomonadaceae bacterium]